MHPIPIKGVPASVDRHATAVMALFEEFIAEISDEKYASIRICVEAEFRRAVQQPTSHGAGDTP